MDAGDAPGLDLGEALGAEAEASGQVLSVYIPNRDRNGRRIANRQWIREAEKILGRLGEGFTPTPPHDGGWETGGGVVRREKTTIVYTYIKPDSFRQRLPELRSFLHRFGRRTRQEVVVVELTGGGQSFFFRIKEFDR